MHLFSYVVTHDAGFAPNPFGGLLTLATSKPKIRQKARQGDYLIGTGSAKTVGNQKLVYAAQISDIVPLDEYGALPQYKIKQPSSTTEWWRKHGDNIYFLNNGKWQQRKNIHHGKKDVDHDLNGENCLVCDRFWYFGGDAIDIPPELHGIIKQGSAHQRITDDVLVNEFVRWLSKMSEGIHGDPEASKKKKVITATGSVEKVRRET